MEYERTRHERLVRLVGIGTFTALAYAAEMVFRFPVAFLTFDAKDAVITVASLVFGPLAAVGMSLATALLELVTVSATGLWGFLMNFCGSAAFSATAALIFRFRHSISGAVLGVYAATLAMTAVMIPLNLLITPIYTGAPAEAVAEMLPTLLLPFNLAKGLVNSALTLLLYKPVSTALKRAGLIKNEARIPSAESTETVSDVSQESRPMTIGKNTLIAIVSAVITFLFGLMIYLLLLK